jgi:anti-sigma factor RsiW
MATKKQQRRRRRRATGKGRLYDGYAPKPSDERERPKAREPRGRGVPPKPTYLRSIKRAALFAGMLFAVIQFVPLGGTTPSLAGSAIQALFFFVFLVPFGYFMDGFVYNRFVKRQQRG